MRIKTNTLKSKIVKLFFFFLISLYFMRKLFIIYFVFIFQFSLFAQNQHLTPVIIDTDCATDDFRAICQFLSIKELDIRGFIVTNGSLQAKDGVIKLKNLLTSTNRNYPIGVSAVSNSKPTPWQGTCLNLAWGEAKKINNIQYKNALEKYQRYLTENETDVEIVCLGPLTSIFETLQKYPELSKKIKKIIWYNSGYKPTHGFNYEQDSVSAKFIINSKIKLDIISNIDNNFNLNNDFLKQIETSKSKVNQLYFNAFTAKDLVELVSKNHFVFWDDIIPVYVINSELFELKQDLKNPYVSYCQAFNKDAVRINMLKIVNQNYSLEKNIVFEGFPIDNLDYQSDILGIKDSAIAKYGKQEWKYCVLTSEIHGHLGAYSIIGAKMGMLARERLLADIDRFEIVSFAGKVPPYSCLNDGLQISTGATLGVGMIELADDSIYRPEAIFKFENKQIRISLKKQHAQQVENDIKEAILKNGMLTNAYWLAVRRLALKYWLEWDKEQIFDVVENK